MTYNFFHCRYYELINTLPACQKGVHIRRKAHLMTTNKVLNVNINLLVGDLPAQQAYLIESVPGKPLHFQLKYTKELLEVVAPEYRQNFQQSPLEEFVNANVVKDCAIGLIVLGRDEMWLTQLLALSFDMDASEVEFVDIRGQVTRLAAESYVTIKFDGDFYVKLMISIATVVKINWLPPALDEWMARKRSWPLLDSVAHLLDHCYLIAAASEAEKEKEFATEWSLSMFHVEVHLAENRSPLQKRVNYLLKALLYKFLVPLEKEFMFYAKTVMMWTVEEHGCRDIFWEDDMGCLAYLISRLIVCVRRRKLSHYFVPRVNVIGAMKNEEKVLKQLVRINDDLQGHLTRLNINNCFEYFSNIARDCSILNETTERVFLHKNLEQVENKGFAELKKKVGKFLFMLITFN